MRLPIIPLRDRYGQRAKHEGRSEFPEIVKQRMTMAQKPDAARWMMRAIRSAPAHDGGQNVNFFDGPALAECAAQAGRGRDEMASDQAF
jgi:hypothetical protein